LNRAASEVASSLETMPTPRDIRDTEFARLKAMLSQVKLGLDTSSRSVTQLRRVMKKETPHEPGQFDSAYVQVRACEVALRKSILAASMASPEEASAAQAQVASDYEAYARSVTVAEATARASGGALAENSRLAP
jgi:hypothetical protein